jgi:hypothetical protein
MSDQAELPFCPICGNPMQLRDFQEIVRQQLGIIYTEDDAPYEIVCCEQVLRISNENVRKQTIQLLKEFHNSAKEK